MEVKVPRDILKYEESIFFGLTMRQFLYSLVAVGIAVGIFFLCRDSLGIEGTSWVCILGAVPPALLGFVNYHGMTAGELAAAWIKSEILFPSVLVFRSDNMYEHIITTARLDRERERRKQASTFGKLSQKLTRLVPPKLRKAVQGKPSLFAFAKQGQRRERNYESHGRNIFKYQKRGAK